MIRIKKITVVCDVTVADGVQYYVSPNTVARTGVDIVFDLLYQKLLPSLDGLSCP